MCVGFSVWQVNIAWPLATLVGLHQNIHVMKTFAERVSTNILVLFVGCPTQKRTGTPFLQHFIQQSVWAMDNRDFMVHLSTPHKLGSYCLNGHKRCLKPETVLLFFVLTSMFLHYSFFAEIKTLSH